MTQGKRSRNGATRTAPNGYHYTKTEDGWRLTHHLTAEKKLGRPIASNERVVFVNGFDRKDYANPDAIEVVVKREKSAAVRRAELEAEIEALQAKLDLLE